MTAEAPRDPAGTEVGQETTAEEPKTFAERVDSFANSHIENGNVAAEQRLEQLKQLYDQNIEVANNFLIPDQFLQIQPMMEENLGLEVELAFSNPPRIVSRGRRKVIIGNPQFTIEMRWSEDQLGPKEEESAERDENVLRVVIDNGEIRIGPGAHGRLMADLISAEELNNALFAALHSKLTSSLKVETVSPKAKGPED